MNVTPQSPIFNFNERLSLNDKMAEGDDTSLDDIKLSDFDLDFDVWKTVIDETQEEHMSSLEKKQDQNISYSSSDITQNQFSKDQISFCHC